MKISLPASLSAFLPAPLRKVLKRLAIGGAALFIAALLVAAVIVLQVDFVGAEKSAVARLEQETGLTISYSAREEARFPSPHVIYRGLSVRRAGLDIIKAQHADLRFSLVDLLDGNLDFPVLSLKGAEAVLETGTLTGALRSPKAIVETLERLAAIFDQQRAISRFNLVIEAGQLVLRSSTGATDAELGPLAFVLEYSGDRARLQARLSQAGSGRPGKDVPLAQQPLKISLSLPAKAGEAQGRAESLRLDASLGDSSLSIAGGMRTALETNVQGSLKAQLGNSFERLIGLPMLTASERAEPSTLEANVSFDTRGIGLDKLKVAVGRRSVTGIATLREVGERWSISSTLGGDLVDGTAAHRVLQGVRDEKGGWSKAPLNLNPLPQIDLDLRLSSKAFRLGRFALSDVALSVLTRATRAEVAIVDSRFGEGSFKARVVVGDGADRSQTLRVSFSGENVESGELLDQAFGFDRITGPGSFVVQASGQGRTVAEQLSTLNGTAAFDIKDGVVTGIDLNRLMNRAADQRPETALLFSLVGKTPFEALRADFALRDGKMETVGSRFLTKTADAVMEGVSDLGLQQHRQSVVLRKRGENDNPQGEFFGFRLEGPLFSPSIKPDGRLLQDKR